MKHKFKFSLIAIAFILVVSSAFTIVPAITSHGSSEPEAVRAGERHWFASDDATYTNRYQTIESEMSLLASIQTSYNFYSSQVTGSTPYEFGYLTANSAGDPVATIFRKPK